MLNASSSSASFSTTVHRICAVFATVVFPLFTFFVNVTTYVPGFVGVPTIVWPYCFTCVFFLSLYVVADANASPTGRPATFATLPPTAATSFVKSHSNGTYAIVVMFASSSPKSAASGALGLTNTRYFMVS